VDGEAGTLGRAARRIALHMCVIMTKLVRADGYSNVDARRRVVSSNSLDEKLSKVEEFDLCWLRL
jgi:hypothetical protein